MADTQDILKYIKNHPKITSRQLAEHFKMRPDSMSSRLTLMTQQGRVSRSVVGKTVSNVVIYGYEFVSFGSKKREVTQSNAKPPAKKHEELCLSAEPVGQTHGSVETSLDFGNAVEQLSQALAAAIVGRVKANLAVELNSLVPEPVTVTLPTHQELLDRIKKPAAVADNRRKVGVVGLLPVQAGELMKDFSDVYDLRFWKDESMGALIALCKAVEVVLLHVGHISHNVQDVAKANAKEVRLVGGGVTRMKDVLTSMYVKED